MTVMYTESPAEAFKAIADVYEYAVDVEETVTIDRRENGDEMAVELDYIDPEGKRTDVDAFRPTYEIDAFIIDFGDELPDD